MQTNQQLQFAGLIQEHRSLVYSVINSYCDDENYKDDLYQDIALRAWAAYSSFTGKSKFTTWLYSIAKNTAIDRSRRSNKLRAILTHNFLWDIEDTPYSEESTTRINLSVIEKLSETEKRTLQMRIDGLTFDEISKQTDEPINRLLIRMHRIKKLLTDGVKRKYVPVAQRKSRKRNPATLLEPTKS